MLILLLYSGVTALKAIAFATNWLEGKGDSIIEYISVLKKMYYTHLPTHTHICHLIHITIEMYCPLGPDCTYLF